MENFNLEGKIQQIYKEGYDSGYYGILAIISIATIIALITYVKTLGYCFLFSLMFFLFIGTVFYLSIKNIIKDRIELWTNEHKLLQKFISGEKIFVKIDGTLKSVSTEKGFFFDKEKMILTSEDISYDINCSKVTLTA